MTLCHIKQLIRTIFAICFAFAGRFWINFCMIYHLFSVLMFQPSFDACVGKGNFVQQEKERINQEGWTYFLISKLSASPFYKDELACKKMWMTEHHAILLGPCRHLQCNLQLLPSDIGRISLEVNQKGCEFIYWGKCFRWPFSPSCPRKLIRFLSAWDMYRVGTWDVSM